MSTAPLRLRAEDADDLGLMSAAIQDAVFRMGDLSYLSKERRFLAGLNRFRWETAGKRGPYHRIRSALAVEDVLAVRSRSVRLGAGDATGAILDMAFDPGEPPGGRITLRLAGGGEIAIDVDCIDVTLTDFGDPWTTPRRPDHERA